jgi:AraC family ethanolamine operon transcriptional activator
MPSGPAIQKLQAGGNSVAPLSPGLFPAGLVASLEYRDADALTTAVSKWNHHAVQLGSGPFHGRLSQAHTSWLQLYRAAWSPGMLVQGHATPGSMVFAVQRGGAQRAVWRGEELAASQVIMLDGGHEIDFHTQLDCDMLVVSIDTSVLGEHIEALRGRPLAPAGTDARLVLASGTAKHELVHRWMTLLTGALRLGRDLTDRRIAAQLEATVLEALLTSALTSGRDAPLVERRRAALRARQYMVLNMDEPLTIQDICLASRTTQRTLHLGFRDAFGTSPKRFLKALRLNAIHRDLQRAKPNETVTDLACRRGFFHFSNFAADYRRLFGELPSETLRRSGTAGQLAAAS